MKKNTLARTFQNNVVAVRVTDEEYAIIRAAAAADERSVANYVRLHILARAIQDTAHR